jgi:hypothetical protein
MRPYGPSPLPDRPLLNVNLQMMRWHLRPFGRPEEDQVHDTTLAGVQGACPTTPCACCGRIPCAHYGPSR